MAKNIDEEEIVKALSLEEAALEEFKRRKSSLPAQNHSKTSNEKSIRNSLYSSSSSINTSRNVEEPDLISFSHEIQNVATAKENPEDPYNKIKESILKLNESRNQQQLVPYNNQQLATQSLYSINNASCSQQIFTANQYYSQQMYFSPTPYPRIGFENYALQSNYSTYSYPNINQPSPYGFSIPRQTLWNSAQQPGNSSTNNFIQAPAALPPTASSSSFQSTSSLSLDSKPSKEVLSSKSSSSDIRYAEASADNSGNLINLDADDSNFFASILQTFDPLVSNQSQEANSSYYSDQDPFDYIYRGGTQYSDPLYEAVTRSDRSVTSPKNQSKQENPEYYIPSTHSQVYSSYDEPPPLPPRNNYADNQSENNLNYQQIYTNQYSKKLYENVIERRKYDKDLLAFYTMIKELRSKYVYNDDASNIGHIVAAQLDSKYLNVSSIKILVYPSYECFEDPNKYMMASRNRCVENFQKLDGYCPPVIFTCDINSSVIHVIMQCLTVLENEMTGTAENYALKTIGSQEWLSWNSSLSHLEYIHNSIKLEKDVQLGLFPRRDKYMKVIARTHQDDVRDAELKIENILPKDPGSSISYENIIILLETLEMEIDKLESASVTQTVAALNASGVVQAVKAICALLGAFDTSELYTAINNLKDTCDEQFSKLQSQGINMKSTINIVSEKGNYARVTMRPRSVNEEIKFRCAEVRDSVQHLLEVYTQAFQVNFTVNRPQWNTAIISIENVVKDCVMLNIMALHRLPLTWKYEEYMLGVQIFHGTRFIGEPMIAQCANSMLGFFPRLAFDRWMTFEDVPICCLPREARFVFVLYGCVKQPVEGQSNDNAQNSSQEAQITKIELGWASIQFFDFERQMIQGTYFLSLWPPSPDKYYCPSPPRGTHPQGDICPVLSIEIPSYGGCLVFPDVTPNINVPKLEFECLDKNLQEELIDTIDQAFMFNRIDKREVLWDKRNYLHSIPKALPKVLNAAHDWSYASLPNLHGMINKWTPLEPLEAIELLLPRFPDLHVRAQAVKWISKMTHDELIDYLPQLLQALKFDCYESSPLACFLLGRSLDSPRIAHYLYWLLIQNLPGDCPQNTMETNQNYEDNYILLQCRFHRRNQLMLRALLAICGENLCRRFLSQNVLCKSLDDVARSVKTAKESLKLPFLRQNVENVHQILSETHTCLPLAPGLEVRGVVSKTCSYFNSNTLPLKINFMGPDNLIIPAIFKCGDDLQQDMLTLQIVRIIDKMWLKEGLDLKMVSFQCIPTGFKKGFIEMITDAETLRKIQVEWGLTGSFKDKPIAEWLQKQNPNQLEYQRAVDNFTSSCAGYSIITYILGICDRHNDNIMLKTSGHLFHIDFGKFLGDAQMFGNFKRDRTPFVLTSDMAYVINQGDKPSAKFHYFVDLCCKAFNIVRKHGDLLLHIFALMASSAIPGITSDSVNYVRNALMPGASNPEAAANFAKMIHVSLKSWFTQFNFFLHNLAQMRFNNDGQGGELLSFASKTYTVAQEGPISNIIVHGYQKRYDLEKYYTYILILMRENHPDPVYLFRSYKEFCELHQKLCLLFPLARLHSLQSGIFVGRSNIKTVADRRLPEVKKFIHSLLHSSSEIINSDLVITFFHPLLRDQKEADIHAVKVREDTQTTETNNICGEIKFSIHYHRETFIVMIQHARSLPLTTNGQEPNTYVKSYLVPDRKKITKRKTRVVKKSCFPSFMETLEYRMPIQIIKLKTLQVTIWSHDSLQENEFLGGVLVPLGGLNLNEEIVGWHQLVYLPRTT